MHASFCLLSAALLSSAATCGGNVVVDGAGTTSGSSSTGAGDATTTSSASSTSAGDATTTSSSGGAGAGGATTTSSSSGGATCPGFYGIKLSFEDQAFTLASSCANPMWNPTSSSEAIGYVEDASNYVEIAGCQDDSPGSARLLLEAPGGGGLGGIGPAAGSFIDSMGTAWIPSGPFFLTFTQFGAVGDTITGSFTVSLITGTSTPSLATGEFSVCRVPDQPSP
jgi:hypothetical protein